MAASKSLYRRGRARYGGEVIHAEIRRTPLGDRLRQCWERVELMCQQRRGPKISRPPRATDDDLLLIVTLADAISHIDVLERELAWRRAGAKPLKFEGDDDE